LINITANPVGGGGTFFTKNLVTSFLAQKQNIQVKKKQASEKKKEAPKPHAGSNHQTMDDGKR
jgi:hypothetical protein